MKMKMCIKCNERPAVIFFNHIVDGEKRTDGYCIRCAREIDDPNIKQILDQLNIPEDLEEIINGVSAEDIENLPDFPEMPEEDADEAEENESEEKPDGGQDPFNGHAPSMDFMKLFGPLFGHNGSAAPNQKKESEQKQKEPHNKKKKFLTLYCTDLTEKAKKGEIDDVIGRNNELQRVMQILCRRQKNNPCLIGEPGVGKTAVAEALALKIARGDVPYKLANKEVHLLDMTALVAGTQFRGQFEKRMKDLIDEVKKLGNIILVIDEVHTIASAGDAEGSMNAANILKPALSRGEIQVIGATTLTEYRKYIEKDAALERRFQSVMIDEPSLNDCVEILKGISKYYEKFHGISVDPEVLRRTVILSERYITDRFLPDKAIDLLDEALSNVSINSEALKKYNEAKDRLKLASEERARIEAITDPEDTETYFRQLAEAKTNELRLSQETEALEKEASKIRLTEADVAKVIEVWTGIPASNITEGDYDKVIRLDDALKARIIGQDEAISAIVRAVKRSRAGISPKKKPVSFIFAGPTGVGKTELVKVLASTLFDSPETLIRLDMSEFMEKFAVSRIIGAPPGYVGYDEAGQLTEKIRRKPYSVVLFDEIEKAHPDVMNILLQILDDGRITDAQGRVVNFENTIIVMTTNAGSGSASSSLGFGSSIHDSDKAKTEKALSEFLRPEFINRVDEVIVFNRLSPDNFVGIADIMLRELRDSLAEKNVSLMWTDAVCSYVAENSFSEKMGARNMRRYIAKSIEDMIADILFEKRSVKGISVSVSDGALKFDSI